VGQPILERWVNEQVGLRGLAGRMREEAPMWARTVPQIPRLVHRILNDDAPRRLEQAIDRLEAAQRRQTVVLVVIAAALATMAFAYFLR
jgi:ubiquinone biosynthesis protein